MTVSGVVSRGRRAAEARMDSTVTVRRESANVTDPETGLEGPGWVDVVTGVAFRLAGADAGSSTTRTVTVGGMETQVALRTGHFPAATAGLRDGDYVDITAGEHAGTVVQILEATGADQQTALRVPVFEVPRPEGWA